MQLNAKQKIERLMWEDKHLYDIGILDLSDCPITIDDIDLLSNWLNDKSGLHTLRLNNCKLGEQQSVREQFAQTEDRTAAGIYAASPDSSRSRHARSLQPTKAKALTNLLKKHVFWETVELSNNNLNASEMQLLLIALTELPFLRRLNLSYCALTAFNIREFKKMIDYGRDSKCVKKLKYLEIEGCNLGADEMNQIYKILKGNPILSELNLKGNEVDEQMQNKITWDLVAVCTNYVRIDLPPGMDSDLAVAMNERLTSNKQKVQLEVNKVLERQNLINIAYVAIDEENERWLEVLIGLKQEVKTEEYKFNTKRLALTEKVHRLLFRQTLLAKQLELLKSFRNEAFIPLTEIKAEQDKIISSAVKKICEAFQNALSQMRYSEYDNPSIAEEKKRSLYPIAQQQSLVKEFSDLLNIEAKEFTFPLSIRLDNEELAKLEKALNEVMDEKTKMEQDLKALEEKHNEFIKRYQILRNKIRGLDKSNNNDHYTELNGTDIYANIDKIREEIEERLLETRLSPEMRLDHRGSLLHYAYRNNKVKALKFLLQQGADPFSSSPEEPSLFSQVLNSTTKTECRQAVITHIQHGINTFWFNHIESLSKEMNLLVALKKHLDEYLTILLNNTAKSWFLQMISGIARNLNDRKKQLEDHYLDLQHAALFSEEHKLIPILHDIEHRAKYSKRGALDASKLHKEIQKMVAAYFGTTKMKEADKKLDEIYSANKNEAHQDAINKMKLAYEDLKKSAEEKEEENAKIRIAVAEGLSKQAMFQRERDEALDKQQETEEACIKAREVLAQKTKEFEKELNYKNQDLWQTKGELKSTQEKFSQKEEEVWRLRGERFVSEERYRILSEKYIEEDRELIRTKQELSNSAEELKIYKDKLRGSEAELKTYKAKLGPSEELKETKEKLRNYEKELKRTKGKLANAKIELKSKQEKLDTMMSSYNKTNMLLTSLLSQKRLEQPIAEIISINDILPKAATANPSPAKNEHSTYSTEKSVAAAPSFWQPNEILTEKALEPDANKESLTFP